MADEEVKVHIRTEADNRGAVDAKAKIVELREEAARLRQSAEVYSQKGGFEDPRARSARSEAAAREREANRLERPINTADKSAQKAERDAKAAALREERASTKAAAREAAEEKKKFAAEDKAEKSAATAAQREQTKAVAAADREQRKTASAEKKQEREEEKKAAQEETRRQRFGKAAGGVAGGAALFALHELFNEYTERQGIALRDQAARTMNARGLAIGASWRGTSGQSQSDEFAIKQQMDEREANRAEVDRAADAKKWQHGLAGVGAGAATGAAIGSIVPVIGTAIGAIVGGILGGAGGMIHGGREGALTKSERDAAQKRDAQLLEDQKALTRKKFTEEEGGIEMDLARHRAARSMSGSRAAFVDEQKKAWLARYRSLRGAGATDEEASQTAGLEAQTKMRDVQQAAGAGLVTARSGAGDIAAAARWAGMSTPGMAETANAINALHETVKSNSQKAEELHGRKDQSIR